MDGTSLNKLIFVLECIGEKIERFVAVIENNHKEHEAYTEKVLLENETQRELLNGLTKLNKNFDKWFELQNERASEQYEGAVEYEESLYWSNEDGWVGVSMADVFTTEEKNAYGLPVGGEWWETSEGHWVIEQQDKSHG